jgi:hypothetical protein
VIATALKKRKTLYDIHLELTLDKLCMNDGEVRPNARHKNKHLLSSHFPNMFDVASSPLRIEGCRHSGVMRSQICPINCKINPSAAASQFFLPLVDTQYIVCSQQRGENGVLSSSRKGVPRQCHGPTAILRQTTKTVLVENVLKVRRHVLASI